MRLRRRPAAEGGPRPDPWRDAHVVITGGSQGIGAAVARAAAAAGARVSLIARGAEALVALAAETHGQWVSCDVTDPGALTAAVAELEAAQGPCDILVCAAGVSLPGRFLEVPLEEFESQMRVNYLGSVYAVRSVLPGMVTRRRGHVVLTSSTAGLVGVVGLSGYAATKFALVGLASSLRYEVEPAGVKVSVLFPPDTDTPGLAAENLRKPVETVAVSGTIDVMPPAQVAAAVIHGVRRGRSQITADPMTAALTIAGSTLEPLVRPVMRRTIRTALTRAGRGVPVGGDPHPDSHTAGRAGGSS